jgi:hypothetical protein
VLMGCHSKKKKKNSGLWRHNKRKRKKSMMETSSQMSQRMRTQMEVTLFVIVTVSYFHVFVAELGRLQWIERTKADIGNAVPHETNSIWNCAVCGNQCIGTSFVRFPERRDLGSPSCNVHVFDCALNFRKQYDLTYDWESKVGVPKPAFDVDGHPVEPKLESDEAKK